MANVHDFNDKKSLSVFVAEGVPEADLGEVLGNLPKHSLVLSSVATVTTVSGTTNATVDVVVGGTVQSNEVAATAAASVASQTPVMLAGGGTVVVNAGAIAPATGLLVFNVTVVYAEIRKATGELTTV